MQAVATSSERLTLGGYRLVFDSLREPVLVVAPDGTLVTHNPAAEALFGPILGRRGVRCCDLVGCGEGGDERPLGFACITAAVLEHGRTLDELEATVNGHAVAVVASPLGSNEGAVLHVRLLEAASVPAEVPKLRVRTLGPLQLELDGEPLNGAWLHHKPGQLFKYLLCARGHRVSVEELVEVLWPDTERVGIVSLRQAVHQLRERLEPYRPKHTPSRFLLSRRGAYELDLSQICVDADDFEREGRAALLSLERTEASEGRLARAAQLYQGDFLAGEREVDWALSERERLRALANLILRELANSHIASENLAPASSALQRLADLEPLDLDVQRDLIGLMLRRGRHADAARRYDLFRRRFRQAFDQEPGFALAELAAQASGSAH
jgi:DNA-binding SARP family transcriptional activator